MEVMEWYKYRHTACRQEPKHDVYFQGKMITVGECTCKGPRELEVVPLTRETYLKRLREAKKAA